MARKKLLYGLLQFLPVLALANADFNETLLDNCLDFDLAQVVKYTSRLNSTPNHPLNFTSSSEDVRDKFQPFGALESDWFRLNLLRDALPEDSTLKKRFKHIFRLLLIAHNQATKSAHSGGIQREFQDNDKKKTTELYYTEKKGNMQEISKQTPIVEREEYLSSISPRQKGKENVKILTSIQTSGDSTFDDFDTTTRSLSILDTEDSVDLATTSKSSEFTTFDYKEEKSTAPTILDNETGHIESSKIFEDSISTVDMSDYFSNTSLDTQINVTEISMVTEPRETSSYETTIIPISTTMSDKEIISNSSHENASFISNVFFSTASMLQPTTVEEETNSSARESQGIFEIGSSNLSSSTGITLKNEFEQSTISNFVSTKISSLPSTMSKQLSTSTKMAADNTSWTLSLNTKIPVKFFPRSESLGSTTTERVSISTMARVENSSGLQSSMTMHLAKQFSTPEVISSTTTFINSATTQSVSITAPSEELSTSRDGKSEETSSKRFSPSEEYSSTTRLINSSTTESLLITGPSEESSTSKERKLEKISLTPLSIPEEDSSTTIFINSPTMESVSITIPSEEFSVSGDGELEKTFSSTLSTPEEYSSTATFINSPTTQSVSIMNPTNQKLDKAPWAPFTIPKKYSSAASFENTPTVQITTSSEELSIPTDRNSEKAWTPFTTSAEFISEEIIVSPTTMDSQARITTLSDDNLEITNEKGGQNLWISPSTMADPKEELTNTESPIWIDNVTLTFLEKEDNLSNETRTQSTSEVESFSESLTSQFQESWTTSISARRDSSEDVMRTMISSTKNDEIKTKSYVDQTEILMHKSANNKSDDFTRTSTIFTTRSDLLEQTVQTDFTDETRSYSDKQSTLTSVKELTEGSSGSKYTDKWETSKSEILKNNLTSESRKNETRSTTESTKNDTSAIIGQIETSSYLETSTIQARPNYVKNPLHHSSSGNNIFRDYKHDSNGTGSERNAESLQIVLYESGAGSRNRSVWRPHLARQPPAGNNIWRFDTIPKDVNPNANQRPSPSMKTTNDKINDKESEHLTKWPFHGRTNVLRSRKRGSNNGSIKKQFIWFYRQAGQSEDRDKSRNKENDDTNIKIQCNNSRRR